MSDDNTEANGKRRATDRHRLMEWLDRALMRRPVQLALTGVLIGLTALLVGPSLGKSESLLQGLKVGEPAKKTIKATRSFSQPPSEEAVQRQRAAAAAKVLPVFDHQADRGADLLSRINRAFEAVTAAEAKRSGEAGGETKPGAARPGVDELRRRFSSALEIEVPKQVYEELHRQAFSSDIRAAVVMLIGGMMEKLIVTHRSVLKPFAGRTIVVRRLVDGRPSGQGDEQLDSFTRIKDLAEIEAYIRHQANVHGAKLSAKARGAVVRLVETLAVANVNLTFNRAETERRKQTARNKIRSEPRPYAKGEVIVRDGMLVTEEHRRIIAKMESAYRGVSRVQMTLIGIALLVTMLLGVVQRFAGNHFRRLDLRPRDMLTMGVLALGLLGLMRGALALTDPGQLTVVPYLLPIAAGPMLVRLLIGAEAAALFAVIIGALCGLMVERSGNLGLMIFYLVTGLVGAAGMAKVQSRSTVLRAGLFAGVIGAVTALCLALVGGHLELSTLLYVVLAALAGGLCASFVTLALLPAVEWLFAFTTDVSLLELANLNHPLLRDLMIRAPGTYHHSMVVGNLSEAACEAIGANPLLAHVSANFHDVGKMKNAPYFAENFKGGDNPHNRLKPSMSGLIIRNHLKHSLEMLREHGLPEPVIDIATQHHGTTLIEFFFHKAKKETEDLEEVHEEDYRYPGPKPQTREAGVLMLADGVEAAARSLAEPTEDRLRSVVQRVINAKFADGQLDHCDLTLRDLHLIAKAFLQVLRGIYHQRPTYPWQRDREQPRDAVRRDGTIKRDTARRDAVKRDQTPSKAKRGEEQEAAAVDAGDRTESNGSQRGQEKRGQEKRGQEKRSQEKRGQEKRGQEATAQRKDGTGKQGKEVKGKGEAGPKQRGRPAAEHDEPEGEGESQEAAEPRGPDEVAPEGSPDIKRLGLN